MECVLSIRKPQGHTSAGSNKRTKIEIDSVNVCVYSSKMTPPIDFKLGGVVL